MSGAEAQLRIRLTKKEWAYLKSVAARNDLSVTMLAVGALREWIDKRGDAIPDDILMPRSQGRRIEAIKKLKEQEVAE